MQEVHYQCTVSGIFTINHERIIGKHYQQQHGTVKVRKPQAQYSTFYTCHVLNSLHAQEL